MQLAPFAVSLTAVSLFACTSTPGDGPADVDAGGDGDGGSIATPVTPSNQGDVGALEPTGLIVGAGGTFDTDIGCLPSSILGRCAPTGDLCVCRADVVTFGDLDVVGTRGLAVLAWRSIHVNGEVRLVAGVGADAPGARRTDMPAAQSLAGGAGGSYGTAGAGSSVSVWGTAELVPLVGGRAGQDSCGDRAGGGGGGAIQLTAGDEITIGVDGGINVGGAGGAGGSSGQCAGGAGGGSGGAILVEAPVVELEGALVANGGGGGGGGGQVLGGAGAAGGWGQTPASGGTDASGWGCTSSGRTYGGWGGKGAAADVAATAGGPSDGVGGCSGGAIWLGEGGGGGGGGRIRINTRTGCNCLGVTSPEPSRGMI